MQRWRATFVPIVVLTLAVACAPSPDDGGPSASGIAAAAALTDDEAGWRRAGEAFFPLADRGYRLSNAYFGLLEDTPPASIDDVLTDDEEIGRGFAALALPSDPEGQRVRGDIGTSPGALVQMRVAAIPSSLPSSPTMR